jgi:hypothetical protein
MKQTRLMKMLVAAVGCAAALGVALAQETTTTTTTTNPVTGTTTTESTTTTSAGTIMAYTPDSDYIMFRTTADAKETTILDPEGHTVTWSTVRPETPATVYYTNVGDRVVVRKIVLSRPTTIYKKEETTTTTTKKP